MGGLPPPWEGGGWVRGEVRRGATHKSKPPYSRPSAWLTRFALARVSGSRRAAAMYNGRRRTGSQGPGRSHQEACQERVMPAAKCQMDREVTAENGSTGEKGLPASVRRRKHENEGGRDGAFFGGNGGRSVKFFEIRGLVRRQSEMP